MKEKTETQFYGTQKPFQENQITELRKMRKNFHSLTNKCHECKSHLTLTYFCTGLSSTLTMSSLLEGIPFKTSPFRRRNMWGPRISWSFLIWSSLATSSNSVRKVFWFLEKTNNKKNSYNKTKDSKNSEQSWIYYTTWHW